MSTTSSSFLTPLNGSTTSKVSSPNPIPSETLALLNVSSDSTFIALPPPDPFLSLNQLTPAKSFTDSACKTATLPKLPSLTPPNFINDLTTKNQPTKNCTA